MLTTTNTSTMRDERRPLRPFRTPVRGHAFAPTPPGASELEAGRLARLAREPGNPADPLAVAVWVETDDGSRWRIGYLDQVVAGRIAPRLDAGGRIEARLAGFVAEPNGRWQRPLVQLLPELPESQGSGTVGDGAGVTRAKKAEGAARGTGGDPDVTSARVWGRPPGVRRRQLRG
jgi:hypothetical protein